MPSAHDPGRLDLGQLQRWVLEHIVGPHRLRRAPEHIADREVSQVILPSKTLTAEQRMNIYADQYIWRLLEVAGTQVPAVRRLLPQGRFERLIRAYLDHHPPSGYSINNLTLALPSYIQNHYDGDDQELLYEMARLECAITDACDTYRVGLVTSEELARVSADMWPALRFRMEPSVRLLAFEYNVVDILDAHHEKQPLPEPVREPRWVAVWRAERKVWRQSITHTRYAILKALGDGETVTAALETASRIWEGGEEELAAVIFDWFSDWVKEGFFSSVIVPEPT